MSADTIVVGAGSSGAVIAARMTERGDRQVLLVEAGPDYAELSALPADLRDGTRNAMTSHDWGLRYRPMPGSPLFPFPRGRVMGGSSAVNTCIALRGQPYDYDEWQERGAEGWGFRDCLPAFKRLERDMDFGGEWHGREGPVPIRRHPPGELAPWQAAFLGACRELGFPEAPDSNDPTRSGYGPHAMNKVGGERMSAARCYLTPAVRARDNLTLRPLTLARRVLFDNGRVAGLEVESSGVVEILRTARVVLSGGAIATPALLVRSGIGPRAVLERLGVPVVSDVPAVGARLYDHPGAAIFLVPRAGVSQLTHPLIQTVLRYTSERSPYPNDMQLQPGSFVPLFPGLTLPAVSIMCCVGKPKGVGRLVFTSADPAASPRVEIDILGHPEDRARAAEAMELAFACARSGPMKHLAHFFWPAARVLSRRASIEAWIEKSCGSGYHPSGTAPMGAEGAPGAATDARGRVRGVSGLYVADASLMPTIPSSNTNLACLMIGERFGEWLREGAI